MASTLTNLLYHIVFSTKERIPLIDDALRDSLYDYIGGILRGQRGILLEIGGMPDHVHLLVKLRADLAVATAVRFRDFKDMPDIDECLLVGPSNSSASEDQVSNNVGLTGPHSQRLDQL